MPWMNKGNYWLNVSHKYSSEWWEVRKYCITPSRMYVCCESYYNDTPQKTAEYIAGVTKKVFTVREQTNLDRGNKDEIDIKKHYEVENDVKLKMFNENEYPAAKFDSLIRGLPDGFIENKQGEIVGIFEAKSKERVPNSFWMTNDKYDHIPRPDYYQMLGYMAMFKVKWCDYCVHIKSSSKIVTQRILFNKEKWEEIYEKLVEFRETLLNPLLKNIPKQIEENHERNEENLNDVPSIRTH
jgi:hypothetical protein